MADGSERLKIALHANGLEKSGNLQQMLDRLLSAGKPPGPVRKSIDKKKNDSKSIVKVIETAIHGKICNRFSEIASDDSSVYDAMLLVATALDGGVAPPKNITAKGLGCLLSVALLK